MSNSRNLADLLDSNGDVKVTALDNTTTEVANPSSRTITDGLTLSNTVNQVTFDAIAYTGNGGTQAITTGMSTIDFTVASNGTGYYHDRTAGDGIVKNDAGTAVASGIISFMDVAGVDGVSQVHIKGRGITVDHNVTDGIRGYNRIIETNNTGIEYTSEAYSTLFTSTGFSLTHTGSGNNTNNNGSTYIAYQTLYTHIKWGLTNQGKRYIEAFNPVTNDTMVLYQGSGVAGHEIPHSVGVALDFYMIKGLDAAVQWEAHFDGNGYLNIDDTGANAVQAGRHSITSEHISLNTLTTWATTLDQSYILYGKAKSKTWTIVEYTGTGAAGNFVETLDSEGVARRPARVIRKRVDAVSSWIVINNKVGTGNFLRLDTSGAESANPEMSFQSNGFTLTGTWANNNALGGQYIALVEFDTNNTGTGGSYEDLPSATTNAQLTDATILYSEFDDGYKQTKETFAGTTTIIPSNGWE